MSSTRRLIILAALAATAVGCRTPRKSPPTLQSARAPGAELVELYAADRFFEGPFWNPGEDALYFTAFGKDNQQILRLEQAGSAAVWHDRTEGINGTFRAKDGRMLGAQAYGHRLVALTPGGPAPRIVDVLASDETWNQPNVVCQSPTGEIFFTDPDFKKREKSRVLRLASDGTVTTVVTDMPTPNGLITSNDGRTLYVGDSHLKHWRAYPINADGSPGEGRVFFDPQVEDRSDPDGMTIDESGNLYLTGRGGVWVVRPDGSLLEFIKVPEFCSNLTFGGKDGRTLFLTCKSKVYSLEMAVRGGPASGRW